MGKAGRIGGIFETGVLRRRSLSAGMVSNLPADGQGLLFEKTAAAGFEFFVRTADAVLFYAG